MPAHLNLTKVIEQHMPLTHIVLIASAITFALVNFTLMATFEISREVFNHWLMLCEPITTRMAPAYGQLGANIGDFPTLLRLTSLATINSLLQVCFLFIGVAAICCDVLLNMGSIAKSIGDLLAARDQKLSTLLFAGVIATAGAAFVDYTIYGRLLMFFGALNSSLAFVVVGVSFYLMFIAALSLFIVIIAGPLVLVGKHPISSNPRCATLSKQGDRQ